MSKRRSKIEVGQCYRKADHVYMVMELITKKGEKHAWVKIQDTLTKIDYFVPDYDIIKWERPFPNYE